MKLKRFLAVIMTCSMISTTIFSGSVGAFDKKRSLSEQRVDSVMNRPNNQAFYLMQHNIAIGRYVAFIHNSGLSFEQMRDILDNDHSVNFNYLYKLSTFMGNHWVSLKHNNISQGEVFKKLLNVAKALHLQYNNLSDIDGLMSANLISLYDLHVFINKGFSAEQKQNLSMGILLKYMNKFAAETFTDFWRSDFTMQGYSGYGVCANIIELSGWNFDQIEKYLGDRYSGLYGLQCVVEFSKKFGFKTEVVAEIFKESEIGFKDVMYLYNEIVNKRGFNCRDFVDSVNGFEGYSVEDYIKVADAAKKSGRTYLAEMEYDLKENQKK